MGGAPLTLSRSVDVVVLLPLPLPGIPPAVLPPAGWLDTMRSECMRLSLAVVRVDHRDYVSKEMAVQLRVEQIELAVCDRYEQLAAVLVRAAAPGDTPRSSGGRTSQPPSPVLGGPAPFSAGAAAPSARASAAPRADHAHLRVLLTARSTAVQSIVVSLSQRPIASLEHEPQEVAEPQIFVDSARVATGRTAGDANSSFAHARIDWSQTPGAFGQGTVASTDPSGINEYVAGVCAARASLTPAREKTAARR